jgi:CxxC-x17-CxxC domain-containing protein
MAFGNDRKMYKVDLKCSKCGKQIDELPFEPSNDSEGNPRPVFCSDCNREFRQKRQGNDRGFGGGGFKGNRPQRQMLSGNWTCSSCGAQISELPFEPRDTSTLLCRSCLQAQRAN